MNGIRTAVSHIEDAVIGNRKHPSSSEPGRIPFNTHQQQEYLDTSCVTKILVIGETGSGKSTVINYLTNYFHNGTLQNLKVAIPSRSHPYVTETFSHCERDIQNTTESKTDACNQYMFSDNDKHYLFLDTPGLSDTRGAKQDDENIVKILDSVEQLGGLTAVIIVINGAVSRLTVNLRNVIARLRGNLPDIIMGNVILVLTHGTRYTTVFSIPHLQLSGNVYPYYMQNSAFSQDPSTWNASALEALQIDWNQAMNEMAAMIHTIDSLQTKSVMAFSQMKKIRNEIKTLMHEVRLEVSKIQKLYDEIAAFEIALKQSDDDLVTYKDYSKEREMEKIEIVDAPFYSTLCQKCNHVCHPKCRLDETTVVGAQIFQKCNVISCGKCTKCPRKCSYTTHYHANKTVKITKQKLQDILTEIKVKYDQAAKNKSDCQEKITSAAGAKHMLEKTLLQKNEDIKQLCIQLRNLCAGFNIVQELHALIDQLETESTMLRNIEAKQQANAFIRSLKEFCTMLENDEDLRQNRLVKMNIIDTSHAVQQIQARLRRNATANNTLLITQQNSSTITFDKPSSDSNSHATNDVSKAIDKFREKMRGEEATKESEEIRKKTIVSSESVSEEEESENNADTATIKDNAEEQSDREVEKRQKQTKKQHALNSSVSTTIDANQLKTLTIRELLDRYNASNDQLMRNFIIYELGQRSRGESLGPLSPPESMFNIAISTHRYGALNANALRQVYQRLRLQIAAITEPNILKIDQVPPLLLIEIAAVHMLLQHAPPGAEPNPNNFSPFMQSFQSNVNLPHDHSGFATHYQNDYRNASTQPPSTFMFNPYSQQPFPGLPQQPQQHSSNFYQHHNTSVTMNEPPRMITEMTILIIFLPINNNNKLTVLTMLFLLQHLRFQLISKAGLAICAYHLISKITTCG